MSKPVPGTIRFYQWCEPPLTVGDYLLTAGQNVAELDNKSFSSSMSFTVGGPAFSLAPADIYSVYPPKGSTGDYASTLPHVIFTRRTLPWEKSLRSGETSASGRQWMALLLLSEDDFADGKLPSIQVKTVAEMIDSDTLRAQKTAGAKLPGLQPFQLKSPSNFVDLSKALFQRIAPRVDDLPYLAHVREVNTEQKETLSFLTDGWFSVIIGNRFPQQNSTLNNGPAENLALLVSLEGMADYLPGSQLSLDTVRVPVLAAWSFRCEAGIQFKASMAKLSTGTLSVPSITGAAATSDGQYINAAFSRGYTALNHNTRLGEKTVSWYRGPLLPLTIPRKARYTFAAVPDALLCYDPETGFLDATYAAASQLGRLLALQDRAFAQSLSAWRSAIQQQWNGIIRRQDMQLAVNSGSTSSDSEDFLQGLLGSVLNGGTAVSTATTKDTIQASTNVDRNPPASVCFWLARRLLLYGVPFSYIVPDERMLPPDSIRFFSLDPLWIKSLLEGACSVGRDSIREQYADELLRERFFDLAASSSSLVRRKEEDGATPAIASLSSTVASGTITLTITGANFGDNSTITINGQEQATLSVSGNGSQLTVTIATKLPDGNYIVSVKNNGSDLVSTGYPLSIGDVSKSEFSAMKYPLEGFLLNSPIVKGWQGLEMEAVGVNGVPSLLRMDRLSPAIMLCVFDRPIQSITIRQPAEGMHFGATVNGATYQRAIVRRIQPNTTGFEPGAQVNLPQAMPLPMLAPRVVDIKKLAQSLHAALIATNCLPANAPFADFTSAEFALQMTESPGRATIRVERQAQP